MPNHPWSLLALLCLSTILCTCAPPPALPVPEPSIYPISFRISSLVHGFPDLRPSTPDIHFDFLNDSVMQVTAGRSEVLPVKMRSTRFDELLSALVDSNLTNNTYWQNPYQQISGILEVTKRVEDSIYTSIYSDFIRRDIPVKYVGMNNQKGPPMARLSDYAHRLAYELLRDTVDENTMLTVGSMHEALKDPERVHTLRLRNRRITKLPPEIGQLVNLRVLDISGSWIRELPPEIGQCRNLWSLLANASRLQKIPPEISQLKKLRDLNIAYCRLKKLPDEIGDLTQLWSISLGGNNLVDLPASMVQLDNVTFFGAGNNRFKEFPRATLGLRSVKNLWLHGNDFTQIPPELADLPELTHFLVDAPEIENIDVLKKARPWVRVIDENGR